MLAVVPRRERSARGMEILSSAWTEGTRDILHHHLRRSEPPDPPPRPSQVLTWRRWKVSTTLSKPGMLSLSTRVTKQARCRRGL